MTQRGDVLPGTGVPGGQADEKYRRLRAAHLRRTRWARWGFGAAGIALITWGGPRADDWVAIACTIGGALLMIAVMSRDWLPWHVEKWDLGAEGERNTAKELERLPDGWHVTHDLNGPYGNIDHLVVGPAGVFVIDTKNWAGRAVTFDRGVPVATRVLDPDDKARWDKLPRNTKAQAARQSAPLAARLGRRIWVTPVVAVWGELEQPARQVDGVTYVRAPHLAEWLLALPAKLTAADVAAINGASR